MHLYHTTALVFTTGSADMIVLACFIYLLDLCWC